ncbi:putative replication factor a 73 kda subunit, partial [Quercus suber]
MEFQKNISGIVMKLQKSISNKIRWNPTRILSCPTNQSLTLMCRVVLIVTNKGYRPVSNDLNIIFLLTTSVKECNEESELIPMHAFDLQHIIVSTMDKELKISLWDESAETITENDFKEDEGPYIIIVTSTIVKAFQGKLNLNTTSASKVYVSELIDRYKVVEDEYDNVVRSIPACDKKPKSESELILQTTMSLAEIKALEWVEGVKERFFTCYADIVNIETEFGWNHISCQLCKRKVKQQNNIYKLQIQVKDHTGTASFVLFDKDAEKIIQKTAMELSLKNQEPNKVPQEIQNLLGKSYTFQIEVDDYNVKEGWEVYTVTSVFKSESNKHSENIVANNIQIKPLETLFSHHQTIANNPIATSDIKLLTSLKDVTDDNLIDDVFGNTQL